MPGLIWTSLWGFLLATVLHLPLSEAAERIGKMKRTHKFREVYKIFRPIEAATSIAAFIKKIYEDQSFYRNRIAHSKCVGFRTTAPEYIVFTVFERHTDESMVADAISISTFDSVSKWARSFSKLSLQLADRFEAELGVKPR